MPKKILLADDSVTIQKVVELTLAGSDYEVVCVGNGDAALQRIREFQPDLLLCDIMMPGKDGYEVCEAVKSDPAVSHIPVLLLTGAFEPFDDERARRVRSDGFLAKPFEPQVLHARILDMLAAAGGADAGPAQAATDAPDFTSAFHDDDWVKQPLTGQVPVTDDRQRAASSDVIEGVDSGEYQSLDDLMPPDEDADTGGQQGAEGDGVPPEVWRRTTMELTREEMRNALLSPGMGEYTDAQGNVDPDVLADLLLSEEVVERIARRVAEIIGERVVREVAWEVVPELAEALIKQEIERLKDELRNA
jgi:CheY-like chemotaxis protein